MIYYVIVSAINPGILVCRELFDNENNAEDAAKYIKTLTKVKEINLDIDTKKSISKVKFSTHINKNSCTN